MIRPMRIAFRTDASFVAGTGHVMRSLSLALEARSHGSDVHFVCRSHAGNLVDLIQGQGFQVHELPQGTGGLASRSLYEDWLGVSWEEDARATVAQLGQGSFDWLVVDHYGLDARWENAVRGVARRIMVIDDLANRSHECDLLLDQNRTEETTAYAPHCPPGCRVLLGPAYALLRPEFLEARKSAAPRSGHLAQLFVFFGGVDASRETAKAMRALKRLSREYSADIVIGPTNPHRAEVEALVGSLPGATLHIGATSMARLMAKADLALGAAGGATWERASVGLPVIAMTVADNQREIGSEIQRLGLGRCLGEASGITEESLAEAILEMADHPDRLRQCSETCWRLVDGLGASRVSSYLLKEVLAP